VNKVFLDTVGLLALWDKSDQWHGAAEQAYQTLVQERAELVTSSFVLLECGNAAARRVYRTAVGRLRNSLEISGGLIVPTSQDWLDAWNAYEQAGTWQAGIVEEVSFVIMRRLGIARAFTNDRHFQMAGFITLF